MGGKATNVATGLVRASLIFASLANLCASPVFAFGNPVDVPTPASTASDATPQLQSTISVTERQPVRSDFIDDLVDAASARDAQVNECNEAIKKFASKQTSVKSHASDIIYWMFMTRGISSSTEAGNLILDERKKVTTLGGAKLMKEKVIDDLELQVVTSVLQLAATVGSPAPNKLEQDKAIRQLEDLVGKEMAENTRATLLNHANDAVPVPCNDIWNVTQLQHRLQTTTQAAALNDRIVGEISADLHRYSVHSKASFVSQKIVRTSLSVVSLTPTIVGPAAQLLLFGYVFLSGGSEETKVMRELYMDKRLETRASVLREEAHLVFDNFRMGVMTKNQVLTTVSQHLLAKLTSPEFADQLLTASKCPTVDEKAMQQVVYKDPSIDSKVIPSESTASSDAHTQSVIKEGDAGMRFVVDAGHQN